MILRSKSGSISSKIIEKARNYKEFKVSQAKLGLAGAAGLAGVSLAEHNKQNKYPLIDHEIGRASDRIQDKIFDTTGFH